MHQEEPPGGTSASTVLGERAAAPAVRGRTPAEHTPPGLRIRSASVIFLVLLVVSTLFNLLVLTKLPGISPVDGIVYADAFDRAMRGEVTVKGDKMGQETTTYIACRGVEGWGNSGIPCSAPDSDLYRGHTTAYVHPPTYFFLTAWLVKGIHLIAPDTYSFDIARIVGGLWFSLGALIMVWLATLWGARPWPTTALMLAVLATPTGSTQFSFITPDSMSLLVCAVVPLGVSLWWRGLVPSWSLLLFGAVSAAVKQTFFLAALASILLIVMLWWPQRRRPTRDFAAAGGYLALGSILSLLGWEIIKRTIAIVDGDISTGPDLFAVERSFNGVFGLIFTGVHDFPSAAAGTLLFVPPAATSMAMGLSFAVVSAAGGALVYRSARSEEFALAAAGAVATVFGGLLLSTMYLISSGIFLPGTVRYVIGGVPILLVPLTLVMRRRAFTCAVVAMAAVSYLGWFLYPGTAQA